MTSRVVSPVVATAAAAMDVIEAAHASELGLQPWAELIRDSTRQLLKSPFVNLGIGRRDEQAYSILAAASFAPAFSRFWAGALADQAEAFDPFARYPNFVGTAIALVGSNPVPEQLSVFQAALSARDILGIVALAGDTSLALGVPSPTPIKLNPRDRWLLTQVALHLETALHLRTQPQAEVARLSPNGAFLDVSDRSLSAQGAGGVKRHVARVEQGRTRQQRKELAAVDAWTALVSGRWVLVEREERGIARHYAIFEAGRGHALRALSEQEARVVELSARGLAGKCTAYALGVAPGTVSKLLASAALKAGLTQLVGALLGVAPPIDTAARLTRTEREVLDLLRLGYSNARIAAARGRSEHTVANQVALLLHKLKAPSRRALATLRSTGAE